MAVDVLSCVPDVLLIYPLLSVCVLVWLVVNPSLTVCNSTLQLDDAGRASYIAGSTSPSPGAGDPPDAVSAYPRSCPLRVVVRSGQTVNITLYSYGRDVGSPWSPAAARRQSTSAAAVRRQRFCPGHVFIGERERSQGAPLCPSGQRRTRHLYLSRGRLVTVHFSAQQRGTATSDSTSSTSAAAATRLYFILKMQGKCLPPHARVLSVFLRRRLQRLYSVRHAAAAAAAAAATDALCLDTAAICVRCYCTLCVSEQVAEFVKLRTFLRRSA